MWDHQHLRSWLVLLDYPHGITESWDKVQIYRYMPFIYFNVCIKDKCSTTDMKAILFVFETRCLKVICAVIGLNTTSD